MFSYAFNWDPRIKVWKNDDGEPMILLETEPMAPREALVFVVNLRRVATKLLAVAE
jgi:hypothetical protein